MKKFIFALCFLALSGPLYGANTGWNPKPDGVHAKSPVIPIFLNQTAIDALTPVAGSIVYNTTIGGVQWYDGTFWLDPVAVGSSFAFNVISGNKVVADEIGIGTHDPETPLHVSGGLGTAVTIENTDVAGSKYIMSAGILGFSQTSFALWETFSAIDLYHLTTFNGDVFIGDRSNLVSEARVTVMNPTGRTGTLLVKGKGTTSATYGLKVWDSTDKELFVVKDDGSMTAAGGVTFSGQSTIFGDYSSKFTENTIFANTSTAAITVTLPDASLNPEGFFQTISKTGPNDNFNSVTLQPYTSTQTINRKATRLIEFPGNTVTVKTERGNWRVVQATPNTLSFTPSSLSTGSTTGDFWTGGGSYHFNATDANLTQASTTVTHGAANEFSGAHVGIVAGGPGSTDAGIVGIRAKGTSIADDGTRIPNDTDIIVADVTAMALNDYFESSKKWNGVVTFELFSSGGATTYSADFNYGHSAYEDFEDNDILLRVFEMDGRAGGNDSAFRVRVYHHEGDGATGWTYAASGFDPGNGTILDSDDIAPENDLVNGEEFKWDRHNLNTAVLGTQGQGMLIRVTTSAANAIRYGNFRYGHIILSK